MKRLPFISLVLVLVLMATAVSALALPQLGKKEPLKKGDTLTEAEIEALEKQWIDEETGHKYFMHVGFGLQKLTQAAKEKAVKKERVPYRLTVSLYRAEKGQTRAKLFKNDLYFYILDEGGEVAQKRVTKSSAVMCPS